MSFPTDDALTVNTNGNVTAPRWLVRQPQLSAQFHHNAIDCEFI